MESTLDSININRFDEINSSNDLSGNLKSRTNETFGASKTTSNSSLKQPKGEARAYETLKKSFNFIELFGWLIGCKMDYEWKGGLRHWFAVTYLILAWSQFFYSQYLYFESGEYKQIFKVFAVYGVALSCTLKLRCFVTYVKEVRAVFHFSFKICRENVGRRAEKLENTLHDNLKLYKLFAFLVLLSPVIYVFYPIKAFVDNRELVPLLPIEIVFIDQSTLSGFLIANAFMLVMGIYAVIGTLYLCLHFIAPIMNYAMQVDLIEMDINELDNLWRTTTSNSKRHIFLRNICRQCQDRDNYIAEVKKIFDETLYLYFCFAYISQVICLYEVKAENWISGYGIAFGLFVEMMLYCFIGTKITIEIVKSIYSYYTVLMEVM